MSQPTITHVLRAPIVGGSELETLAITSNVPGFDHRVVFPSRFESWQPSIREQFDVPVAAVPDLQAFLDDLRTDIVHLQFPFLLVAQPVGHDSVLELLRLPPLPAVFTVHAAVNVPIAPDIHYVFHTHELSSRFRDLIPSERRSVCPSLVAPSTGSSAAPSTGPRRTKQGETCVVLWVSRNEDAKFHPDLAAIVEQALAAEPSLRFHFVGTSNLVRLPADPRITCTPCPAPDLEAAWTTADVFWHFPHPRLEETWCRTVTEAMSHGIPCVVAGHGAMQHQVQDGRNGRVAHTPQACADALIELARLPAAQRRRMSQANRSRAAAFADDSIRHWQSLYRRLSGGLGPH
ncbi:MAG: glycosyltransferase [Planctomycetota bacterium]